MGPTARSQGLCEGVLDLNQASSRLASGSASEETIDDTFGFFDFEAASAGRVSNATLAL